MALLSIFTGAALLVGAGAGVLAATQADTSAGLDMWALVEKGGAPMAGVLLLALIEVTRRHDRAYKIIEAKDATILAMSQRQTTAIETTNEIASDQMKTARNTEQLLREMVTLLRGKLDIG